MRTFPRTLALVSTSAALVATMIAAQPASAEPAAKPAARAAAGLEGQVVPASLFGMTVANAEFGAWPNIPVGAYRVWDNQATWSQMEPAQGTYDWTNLRNTINTARDNGVTDILMVLAGTPAWASDDPASGGLAGVLPGAAGIPRDLTWWDNWVNAVVDNFGTQISSYQIWNEANLSTFSTASPAEMATLTKRAYDIIKRKDPSALVVAPSTGTRLGGPFKKWYPAYLRSLKQLGWPVDVWAVHTYPASLGTPVDRAKLAKMYRQVLNQEGAPNLPIWDTENNFGLKGPGPQNPDVDIEGVKAGQWVARTYLDALDLGMSRVYWYRWESLNDLWGIQMYTDTVGAQAYKTLEGWLVGATYRGCSTARGKTKCSFTRDGNPFAVIYTQNSAPARFTGLSGSQVCKLDGTCEGFSGSALVTAGPVLIK